MLLLQNRVTHFSGLDVGDVIHNVELQIVSAPAIARRTGHPGGRVSPVLQYSSDASHGKGGERFPTVAAEQGGRHPGNCDNGMSPTAGLWCRSLRERRQESSFLHRQTRAFSTFA